MPAALVAQFPWWSLSDPVITFALHLRRGGLEPRLVGPELLDFIARRYPSEAVFEDLPLFRSPDAAHVPALLREALDGPGPRFAVFFDEKSFLSGAAIAANLGARVSLYSTEIPDPGQIDAAALEHAFRASKARLVIQDEDRLRGYEQATGLAFNDALLLPNASLPDVDYGQEDPGIPGIADWSRTLVLSGSIQPEHATLESVEAFLRGFPSWTLLVNGWGGQELARLRDAVRGRAEVVLNTDFLSGPQIRWIYAHCGGGVVSYFNGSYNHRHCGRASGKLYWICRHGKPVLCNDNVSIAGLVKREGLGCGLLEPGARERLERDGADMGRRALEFFQREAAEMAATLGRMFGEGN